MLQVIRDRAQGIFVWIIIGGIVVSFALFGINDYFTGDDTGNEAALVNDEKVSIYEYQVAYSNERSRMQQMFGDNFDADMFDDQLKKTALERVIDIQLLNQSARDLGMRVSDELLLSELAQVESFQSDGRFSKASYEQALAASGEGTARFEYRVRKSLLAQQLISGVSASDFATDSEIQTSHRLRDQERKIAFAQISAKEFEKSVKVDSAELKKFYDENQDRYQTQEQVSLQYLELSAANLRKDVEVTDAELEEYYETEKDRFTKPEERKARHILIETGDDADKAKAKADDLYQQIKNGASFEELAKAHSQDPGSASEGGDLGFFGRGLMDKAFEESAFGLAKDEVSTPIRSEFGYHIIRVDEIKSSDAPTFENIKAELDQELRRERSEKLYFDKVESLANLTYETPDSLTPAAEELGLTVQATPLFGREGGPGIAAENKVKQAAFSDEVLSQKHNSEAIELPGNRTIVIRVKQHNPANVKPFEQVKATIESELRQQQAKQQAKEKGEALLAQINDAANAEKVAKQNKITWNKTDWVKRSGSSVNSEIVKKVFTLAKPTKEKARIEGFALNNGDYALVVFEDVRDGDVKTLKSDEKKNIATSLSMAAGNETSNRLLSGLKDQATIVRNQSNL
ncbi:MAG: SurA N-terminal domain-containing protein [Gammaproteobacteria bacterium]|nr:SurA N-terminal domain-containing protein [Gammaproteobacteria bacterium]